MPVVKKNALVGIMEMELLYTVEWDINGAAAAENSMEVLKIIKARTTSYWHYNSHHFWYTSEN